MVDVANELKFDTRNSKLYCMYHMNVICMICFICKHILKKVKKNVSYSTTEDSQLVGTETV